MSNDLRLEKITRVGIALMQEEKEAALRGDMATLRDIDTRKQEFLAQMNEIARLVEHSGPLAVRESRKQEIQTLFDIIRRRAEENQYLLKAATTGVKSAARQMASLSEASAALGVYAADGERVRAGDAETATKGGLF